MDEIENIQKLTTLYHAALILKSEMNEVVGIQTQPLNPEDISFEKMKHLIPDYLSQFLKWSCSASLKDELKICSIAQSMIYVNSNGTKKTQKHVGIAMGMKNSSRSKEYITVLNRHGDCI